MNPENVLIDILLGIIASIIITSIFIMKENSKLHSYNKIDKRKILKYMVLFLLNLIIFTLYSLFNIKLIIGFYLILLIESLILYSYKGSVVYLHSVISYLIFTVIELIIFFIKKNSMPFYTYNLYVNNQNNILYRCILYLIVYIISDFLINKYKYIISKISNNINNSRQIIIVLSISLSLEIIMKTYLYKNVVNNEGLIYIILIFLFLIYINLFKLRDLYNISTLQEKNTLLETNYLMQKNILKYIKIDIKNIKF